MFFLGLLFSIPVFGRNRPQKQQRNFTNETCQDSGSSNSIYFWAQGPRCFFLAYFFRYLFSAATGHRNNNGILQTRPAKIQAVQIQYIFGPKAPDVFSWLTFFDTCFRPQQAIEKSTEFYKQDLPRFRQLKYNIFLGPRLQMFFQWPVAAENTSRRKKTEIKHLEP